MKNGKIKTTLENLLRKIVRNEKKKSLKGAIKYAKKENQREKQLTIQKKRKTITIFFIFPFLVCSSYILVTINLCKFFFPSIIFKKNAVGYKMSLTFATLEEF